MTSLPTTVTGFVIGLATGFALGLAITLCAGRILLVRGRKTTTTAKQEK